MERVGEVARIRLESGKANAMSAQLLDVIERAFDEFEGSDARAAIVTGYDRYFSAGLALPGLIDLDRATMTRFIVRFDAVMERVLRCPRPIVAAVNGHAIAGGCVLMLQADWRIGAAGDFKIGLNEVQLGIGLPAIVFETLRLRVPPSSLAPIALEGPLFSPQKAQELGLLDELVPSHELETRALAKAQTLAAVPAEAFAQVKAQLRAPALQAVARDPATESWLDTWFSPAAQQRLRAIVDKLGR
jgi:enoyl-CoA hydratase